VGRVAAERNTSENVRVSVPKLDDEAMESDDEYCDIGDIG
jgi:hypothetical protein